MSVIEITGLTKDYPTGFLHLKRVRALDGLSLAVEAGEIFGFLGGNGAGKTTAIKILMRLMTPTSGRARILGHDVADVAVHARLGYLPEQPYFYDYLTARELLEYCAELFGYRPTARRARAADLLRRVHLDEAAWDRQLRKFSKGMLQRVGLAQALVNDPEVVLLRAAGVTVFFSSHIIADIEVLCDRVAILRGGRLAHVGRLDELRQRMDSAGRLEITVIGAPVPALADALRKVDGARVAGTPAGARIDVPSERDVDAALALARGCGARLVAVQPIRQSLEDLFVGDGPRAQHAD